MKLHENDYFNNIVETWKEQYRAIRGIDYFFQKEEYRFIPAIANFLKSQFPEYNTREMLDFIPAYFAAVIGIRNEWHYSKMTIKYLSQNINEINNFLKNGNKQQASTAKRILERGDYLEEFFGS